MTRRDWGKKRRPGIQFLKMSGDEIVYVRPDEVEIERGGGSRRGRQMGEPPPRKEYW